MSFQNKLDDLLNKGRAKLNEFTHPNQPPPANYSYQNRPLPPPINYASKPTSIAPPIPTHPSATTSYQQAPQIPPYWTANFDPSIPIPSLFVQETGAHGWGNNEAQNYTNSPTNSFFTSSHNLVLRGIVSPSLPDGQKYTSARLYTHQTLSRSRGCLTATLSTPCAEGIWPAFWLLPKEPFKWPEDGEVDIFESWNGDKVNHSCLHWGHYNGEDWNKHRALETKIEDMDSRPHTFGFAWDENENENENGNGNGRGGRGRLVWYIDGKPVMKGVIPEGTRRMSDYRVIFNVAMGGNVCAGRLPREGVYDFVVHELRMDDQPYGGWGQFGADWERAPEGHAM